jgi:hypothetical protein
MGRRRNEKEKKMKRKDPGDNGKNEARDNGKKKRQGIMVTSDTRVNGKIGVGDDG